MEESHNKADYEDIDEAEEEALLKSDDDDAVRAESSSPGGAARSPMVVEGADEDSLIYEAAKLAPDGTEIEEEGVNSNDSDDEKEEVNSEDDNGDDEDGMDKTLLEYKSILKELESNQYAYDKYVRLCELSHNTGDLDNIRKAYEQFASVYPLSPELWQRYIGVELSVAQSTKELGHVEQLYRRALSDYYSCDIAKEFAQLVPRCAEPDRIWDELLGTYGIHCLQGQEFFKLYRAFVAEQAQMIITERQDAYIQSFLRELRYPLKNMEESYIELKVYCEKNKEKLEQEIDWSYIDKYYFAAKEHLEKMLPYEDKLKDLGPECYRERQEVYMEYIRALDKILDENVLQTIYERMVTDCCLNVECWQNYIDFLEYRDEFGRPKELQSLPLFEQSAVDVSKRSLRNCPWSVELYVKRMHLLEKLNKTREEIQEVLESAMTAGFPSPESAVTVWMEYLTYLRRHTKWQEEDECEILRKNFNLAWTILGQQWGVLADCNCEILQFWGRLEYGPLQDAKHGKELWTTVMESADNATKSGLWIEFASLEMRRDLEATRKLFSKALHTPGLDNPNVISAAWERFERCNGTIKTLNACMKECRAFLANYSTTTAQDSYTTKPKKKPKAIKRKSNVETVAENATPSKQSRKDEAVNIKGQLGSVSFKDHENQEIDLTKDHLRIFLSNLDYTLTEKDICESLPELKIVNVQLIRSGNGRSRGFGYLELENTAEVEKALSMDRRILNGRPLYISSVLRDKEQRQKFKYSADVEPRKLFVKGLPHDATKEEVEEIFGSYGKLHDVRLVYHKSGRFKNIAYVEYDLESAAGRALLGTDKMELRGHTLSVAVSAPPPKANTTVAVNPAKLLGLSKKHQKVFDQKPRMSLIPSVVRKKLDIGTKQLPTSSESMANGSSAAAVGKTNADFRKLLEK